MIFEYSKRINEDINIESANDRSENGARDAFQYFQDYTWVECNEILFKGEDYLDKENDNRENSDKENQDNNDF